MADVHWKCPVDGFEAMNEKEKEDHLRDNAEDEAHKREAGGTAEVE